MISFNPLHSGAECSERRQTTAWLRKIPPPKGQKQGKEKAKEPAGRGTELRGACGEVTDPSGHAPRLLSFEGQRPEASGRKTRKLVSQQDKASKSGHSASRSPSIPSCAAWAWLALQPASHRLFHSILSLPLPELPLPG